jgi:DNA-nicking Smr family endonuclease
VSDRRKPDKDRDAFERAMADVVRLPPDPRGRVETATPVPTLGPAEEPVVQNGSVMDNYVAAGVDRREIRKLRHGDHVVQGRLDLHGMTVAEARASVGRFVENSRHAQHRCVCIVHGRGLNSAGGVSMLRGPVREVLMRTASVLAFASAPPADGGAGAVYVLLRGPGRNRKA